MSQNRRSWIKSAVLLFAASFALTASSATPETESELCEIYLVPSGTGAYSQTAGEQSLKLVRLLIRKYPILFSETHAEIVKSAADALAISPKTFEEEIQSLRLKTESPPHALVELAARTWGGLVFEMSREAMGAEKFRMSLSEFKKAQSLVQAIKSNPAAESVILQFLRNSSPAFLRIAAKVTAPIKFPKYLFPRDVENSRAAERGYASAYNGVSPLKLGLTNLAKAAFTTTLLQFLNTYAWRNGVWSYDVTQFIGAAITTEATFTLGVRSFEDQTANAYRRLKSLTLRRWASARAQWSSRSDSFFDQQRFVLVPGLPGLEDDSQMVQSFDFAGTRWQLPSEEELATQATHPAQASRMTLEELQSFGSPLADTAQMLSLLTAQKSGQLHSPDAWIQFRAVLETVLKKFRKDQSISRTETLRIFLPLLKVAIKSQRAHQRDLLKLQNLTSATSQSLQDLSNWLGSEIDSMPVPDPSDLHAIHFQELSLSVAHFLSGVSSATGANFDLLLSLGDEVKARIAVLEGFTQYMMLPPKEGRTRFEKADLQEFEALEELWRANTL